MEVASAIKAASLGFVTTAVKDVGQVVAVPALAPRPLFETISLLMTPGFFSHTRGFIMVAVGQAVVKDALPASPLRFVIYRGLC